jgi:hypothetical protein
MHSIPWQNALLSFDFSSANKATSPPTLGLTSNKGNLLPPTLDSSSSFVNPQGVTDWMVR